LARNSLVDSVPVPNGTGIGERALAATGQRLRDVELWRLRLLAHRTPRFVADGADGGHVAAEGGAEIPTTRLSPYLAEPVDFLKLNIEGQELPVLEEAREGLANVEQMTVGSTQWFALVHASRA
jgi:hypothetical protein